MRSLYPVTLDISDRLIVIIGAGSVAVRKTAGLLDAGATRIRVVAPTFHPDIPASVERITSSYQAAHLHGAQLVFATTDSPQVNEQIVRDARSLGILVNRSDEGDSPGDFATPALHRDGDVIVTVSAGSAALSAAIRDRLAPHLRRGDVNMAAAMRLLRPAIRDSGLAPERRRSVFRDLAGEEAISTLETGGVEHLRRWLTARYPDLKL